MKQYPSHRTSASPLLFAARLSFLLIFVIVFTQCTQQTGTEKEDATAEARRPNILFAIADDQSYPHASAYGFKGVNTPGFDRVAREGVLFNNAFAASPGCSPSRAAILTGRNCWQIEEAGTHDSSFPQAYSVYPEILEANGYFVGYTDKGWSPGNWKISGRTRNPAGEAFNEQRLQPPDSGISDNDYSANFSEFLKNRPKGQPFCFWYGASEPHREFEKGAGLKAGKKLEDVEVPGFLPDTEEVRSDLLDYFHEIEWFDQHLARMLDMLEEAGELDNTIVVVTADNGMAFPRAKANLYEYGFHVPLAIRWGNRIRGGRVLDDIVSLTDLAPTYLEAAGIKQPGAGSDKMAISGRSLMNVLLNARTGVADSGRAAAYSSRERHSSSRWNNLGYPQRCVRTSRYLYIRNFTPERWPAGDPRKFEKNGSEGPMHGGYHDIDAGPTFDFMIANREAIAVKKYFHLAVDKRPAEELYDIAKDPFCLTNLAGDPAALKTLIAHRTMLGGYLMATDDPRVTGQGEIFESYPRYSSIRKFPIPDWAMPADSQIPVLK